MQEVTFDLHLALWPAAIHIDFLTKILPKPAVPSSYCHTKTSP